jgi:AcrR family transcriptional regulator
MVYSAAQLIRQGGVSATGVRDVVEHAHAPRGSFQHYFPGGKDQLVSEALLWAGDFAANWVDRYVTGARKPTPAGLFAHLASQWKREFLGRGFGRGCPIMSSAGDLAGTDSPIGDSLRSALSHWLEAIGGALVTMGVPATRSRRLATVMLSALEGAIMLARVQRSVRPLTTVVSDLAPLLDDAVT